MTERFKHSEFQQDDGQYQYYGIEDTEKNFVYNVIGEELEMYDVSEKSLIKILNELDSVNKALKQQLKSEHQMLDNAILLERTRMGQNALKQYREAIQ